MHKRLGKWVAVSGGVIAVITGLLLLRSPGEVRSVTLGDGSKVTVKQVSYGKVHCFVNGSSWQRTLAILPTNITALAKGKVRTLRLPEETLVVWLESERRHPNWIHVLGSNELASTHLNSSDLVVHTSNQVFTCFQITSFPREQRLVCFDVYRTHATKPNAREYLGEFKVKNPCFAQRDQGNFKVAPPSGDFHGEHFALMALNTGLYATGTVAANTMSNQWTELLYRIGTNEPARLSTNFLPRGDWALLTIELRDAFGNFIKEPHPEGRCFPMGGSYMMRRDDGIGLISGSIWLDEIWNVRAEFLRQPTPTLDAAHRWTPSVPIPEKGRKISLNQTGRVEKCAIELLTIENIEEGPPIVSFRLATLEPSYRLDILEVRDQLGSNVVHSFGKRAKTEQRYLVRPNPQSKELQITFGVTHSIVVELSARASLLRTNIARWAKDQ